MANSPFKIMVGQSEIGEASRVKAFGKGLIEAHTFEMAEFFVDTRNAGKLLEIILQKVEKLLVTMFYNISVSFTPFFKTQVMEVLLCRLKVQAKLTSTVRIWRTGHAG